jgi:hypothetical protein
MSAAASADETVELDAEIQVDRSDFRLTWIQLGMVSMKNTITIHAVSIRN